MQFQLSASLECGGQAPLCYRSRLIEYQSGGWPPQSKEALNSTLSESGIVKSRKRNGSVIPESKFVMNMAVASWHSA